MHWLFVHLLCVFSISQEETLESDEVLQHVISSSFFLSARKFQIIEKVLLRPVLGEIYGIIYIKDRTKRKEFRFKEQRDIFFYLIKCNCNIRFIAVTVLPFFVHEIHIDAPVCIV